MQQDSDRPRKSFGGRNSFQNFSRSSRRASNFKHLHPIHKSIFIGDEEAVEESSAQQTRDSHDGSADEQTPLVGLSSKLNHTSHQRTQQLRKQREEHRAQLDSDDREPLLVKRIRRDDGTEAEVIVGQSTLPQTVFNSSNVLVGIGLLSLPLAFKYTGWVIGLIGLFLSAFTTRYTASLLAKCIDVDISLANFADIAYIAYGEKGRAAVTTLFTLELVTASVSLVILFADSLSTLIPKLDNLHWKIICGVILGPLNFVPIRLLGYTSFLGIFCMLSLIVITIVDGCLLDESPGSLRNPATTYAFPQNWKALPRSFGLLMAVWGGHSIFPNIYRDMQHPWKYSNGLRIIFSLTTCMDVTMAILGFLMFGVTVKDEVSTNLLITKGTPYWMAILALVLVAIVPLTKFPLHCIPIVSTLEVLARIDPRAAVSKPNRLNQSRTLTLLLRAIFRIFIVVVIIIISVLAPSFEVVSAVMGALFCFAICIILPCSFHLKMFGKTIPPWQKYLDYFLIVFCSILGVVGTVWEFLPKSWIGLE